PSEYHIQIDSGAIGYVAPPRGNERQAAGGEQNALVELAGRIVRNRRLRVGGEIELPQRQVGRRIVRVERRNRKPKDAVVSRVGDPEISRGIECKVGRHKLSVG